jgi:urease subunit alpha
MFGAYGAVRENTSVTFVSQAAIDNNIATSIGLKKRLVAVKNTRSISKSDLLLNDYQPNIEVDAQTYEVRADGRLLVCEAATELPLAQRYFLF